MADDRIFSTSRTLPFSPQEVYDAFASEEMLVSWWGPDGFTNSFEIFEFQVGGVWQFVMHGPDGKNYPNKNVFTALEPASKVVIRHDGQPYFTLTVQLTEVAGGTDLFWEQAFDDVEIALAVKSIVVPANEQNLDRLTRVLEQKTGRS